MKQIDIPGLGKVTEIVNEDSYLSEPIPLPLFDGKEFRVRVVRSAKNKMKSA